MLTGREERARGNALGGGARGVLRAEKGVPGVDDDGVLLPLAREDDTGGRRLLRRAVDAEELREGLGDAEGGISSVLGR